MMIRSDESKKVNTDKSNGQTYPKRRQRKKLITALLAVTIILLIACIGLLCKYTERQHNRAEKLKQDIAHQQRIVHDLRKQVEQQRQVAVTNSIDALHQKAKFLFASHEELQALTLYTKAVLQLKQSSMSLKLRHQILFDFREIIFDIHEKNRLEGHKHPVTSLVFSPEGKLLASGGENVRLWNVPLGTEIDTFSGHYTGIVFSVAFSSDGTMLASGGTGPELVKIWNVADGSEITTVKVKSGGGAFCVAFNPQGTLLASGGIDRFSSEGKEGNQTIKLWEVKTGMEIMALPGHSYTVRSVAFNQDGTILASGSDDGIIKLWNTSNGAEIMTLHAHSGAVQSVVFSPDGKILASGSDDRTVRLWNVVDGKELVGLYGHSSPVQSIHFSPNGKRLFSGGENAIKVWDVREMREIQTIDCSGRVYASTLNSGDVLLAASTDREFIKLWERGEDRGSITLDGEENEVYAFDLSLDGAILAIGNGEFDKPGTITLWDMNLGKKVITLTGHTNSITSVAFSPDNKTLASGSTDNTIKLWDIVSGQERETLQMQGNIKFSPDGDMLTMAAGNVIKLWDLNNKREFKKLEGHSEYILSLAFSPDGKMIASGSEDALKIWEVDDDGNDIATLQGHGRAVISLGFCSDSKTLASGSFDNTIKLWNIAEEKEIKTFNGHTGSIRSVGFNTDCTILVSGSDDKTIKFWHIPTGEELTTLQGHSDSIRYVKFSQNDKKLVSGSRDGTIKIWNMDLDDLLVCGCKWLQSYLKNNPNISDEDRTLCDDILKNNKD